MGSVIDKIKNLFRVISENRFVILFGMLISVGSGIIYFLAGNLFGELYFFSLTGLGIILSILVLVAWWKLTPRLTIPMTLFITNNPLGKKLFTGGSFCYYEKKMEKEYIPLNAVIQRFIVLLIAWLSLSLFIIGLIGLVIDLPNPSAFIGVLNFDLTNLPNLGALLALLCIVPFILGIFIPTAWSLADLRLKAWDKSQKTNWFVSQKFLTRFSAILGVGGITGTIMKIVRTNATMIVNIPFLLIDMLLIILLPMGIIVTVYGVFLTEKVSGSLKELLGFKEGVSSVTIDSDDSSSSKYSNQSVQISSSGHSYSTDIEEIPKENSNDIGPTDPDEYT